MPVSCPEPRELQELLEGQLPEPRAQELEQHLLGCAKCVSAMRSLKDCTPLAAALRQPISKIETDEGSRVEKLIKAVRTLTLSAASDTDASEADTRPPNPTRACSATSQHEGLAPPQGPGEIGRLGPYQVNKVLGAGGMGKVFAATDPRLDRAVALKVMKAQLADDAEMRERFLREAKAAAAVQHDHIIAIYEVNEDRGVPYMAMPLLQGESLENRLKREKQLPIAEVLHIGREMAAGLAAAHERGLMHRDIKPANTWLEAPNGRVKILDFGLAKVARQAAGLTQAGAVMGTPTYMAPEQAGGREVDERCDLFSLGCVLYHAATGQMPFTGDHVGVILYAVVNNTPESPQSLNPAIPPALAQLIMKLLEKEPDKRPASAKTVVEMIRAIEGGPVRRPSRTGILVAAVGALGIAVGVIAFLSVGSRNRPTADSGQSLSADSGPAATSDTLPKPKAKPPVGQYLCLTGHEKPVHGVAFCDDGRTIVSGSFDGTVRLWELATSEQRAVYDAKSPTVRCVAVANNGAKIAAGCGDTVLRLWDRTTGKMTQEFKGHEKFINSVAFDADGKRVFSAGLDGAVRIWAAGSGKGLGLLHGSMSGVECIALSRDGRSLLCACQNENVYRWNLESDSDQPAGQWRGHSGVVHAVAIAPDGQTAATGGSDNMARVWDVAAGRELHKMPHPDAVQCVAFTPDGKRLVTGCRDMKVRVWDVAHEKELYCWSEHQGRIWGVAVSPDSRYAATGSDDKTVRIWTLPAAE